MATSPLDQHLPGLAGGGVAQAMLDALQRISEEVHMGDTVDAVMTNLVRAVTTHAPWPTAWVGVFDEAHRHTLRSYMAGFSEATRTRWDEWPLENSPSERAIRTGEPVVIPDITRYEPYEYMRTHGAADGFLSALYIPLQVEGMHGVIAFNRRQPHQFTPAEVALGRIISSFASLAFRSVLMRDVAVETEQATLQELTRLNALVTRQNTDLQRVAQVHDRFLRLQLDGHGLDQLCEEVAVLTGVPVVLLDRFHQLVAAASLPPEEALEVAERYAQHAASRPVDDTGIWEIDDRRVLVGHAMDGRESVGTLLMLWGPEGPDDLTVPILEQACLHVALQLLKQRAGLEAEIRLEQDFATSLLSGDNDAELTHRASLLGIRTNAPTQVLRAELQGGPEDLDGRDYAELGRLVQRRLRAADVTAVVVPIGPAELVAVLMSTPAAAPRAVRLACDGIRRSLREGLGALRSNAADGMRVSLGIGTQGTGHAALRNSYAEATRAVSVLLATGRAGGDLTIAEAGSMSLLAATSAHDRDDFVERYLRPLIDYDAKHRTGLVETLQTYFTAVGNVQATAELMFLHISTVRYRLGRIEKISDVSLKSDEDRLCLQIALRVALMSGALEPLRAG
jgi:sugar diacid utilization regulator